MQAGTYWFSCRITAGAMLPEFKGSTLRGGLGHALKRIACALRRQNCHGCLLEANCAYAFLFETRLCKGEFLTTPSRPHPYVLIAPDTPKRYWAEDEEFSFGVTLFGPALHFLPHLVFAVQEMGKSGIGKGAREGNGRFLLESVRHGNAEIYKGGILDTSQPAPQLRLSLEEPEAERIVLTCQAPVRLKHNNRFQADLPFHLVIRAALRRISTLEASYGEGEPRLDYKGLSARATNVRCISAEGQWEEIERYSNRQKRSMLIGGVKGRMVYQGQGLGEFLPVLRYSEAVHLGKQTSFGLGRIHIATEQGT